MDVSGKPFLPDIVWLALAGGIRQVRDDHLGLTAASVSEDDGEGLRFALWVEVRQGIEGCTQMQARVTGQIPDGLGQERSVYA